MEKRFLYWLPRVLGLLFIVFLSMFSFDVFGEYHGWELLVAFIMHIIPSLVLIGVLVLAWKIPKWGGAAYIVLGIIFTIFFKTYTEIISFLLISSPLLIVGGLFYWESTKKKE